METSKIYPDWAKTQEEKDYFDWVHQSGLIPLTGTQVEFALFLLKNKDLVKQVGGLESVFNSIRTFLRK